MPEQHIEEDLLEQYAMGTLREEALAHIEEHLLLCESCQDRLQETDQFISLFRAAATQADIRPAAWWRGWLPVCRLILAGAAVAAVLLLIWLPAGSRKVNLPASIVVMRSLRGPESGAQIAAGGPAQLVFDLPPSAAREQYQIRVVDLRGKEILRTAAAVQAGRITARIEKLSRGGYWVRVYRVPDDGELMAEYGLRAQ